MTAVQGITIVVRHDATPSLVVDFGSFPGSWHPLGEDATHFIGEVYKLRNVSNPLLADAVYYRGPRTPGLFQVTVVTTGVVHVLVSLSIARDQVALSTTSEWQERLLPHMRSDAFPDTEGFRMWTPELQNGARLYTWSNPPSTIQPYHPRPPFLLLTSCPSHPLPPSAPIHSRGVHRRPLLQSREA